MKSFKTFLSESSVYPTNSRGRVISGQKAIALLKERCSECFKYDEPVLVRGLNVDMGNYVFYTPGLNHRTSANTTNEYTTIIDNSPDWSDYPKRSESLVCGTIGNFDYAASFGNLALVFPIDNGSKDFGVCSYFDFWGSFKNVNILFVTDGLDDFNSVIREIYRKTILVLRQINMNPLMI